MNEGIWYRIPDSVLREPWTPRERRMGRDGLNGTLAVPIHKGAHKGAAASGDHPFTPEKPRP